MSYILIDIDSNIIFIHLLNIVGIHTNNVSITFLIYLFIKIDEKTLKYLRGRIVTSLYYYYYLFTLLTVLSIIIR